MIKNFITSAVMVLFSPIFLFAQNLQLSSPTGNIKVSVKTKPTVQFEVMKERKVILPQVNLSMNIEGNTIPGDNGRIKKTRTLTTDVEEKRVVAVKNAVVRENYNQLEIPYREGYKIVFRAYDDAVAYRFETAFKDSITVRDELFSLFFPEGSTAWYSFLDNTEKVSEKWENTYERPYSEQSIGELGNRRTQLPLLINIPSGEKIMITESDLIDYPGLYFTGESENSIRSIFPPRVKTNFQNIRGEANWDRILRPESVYDDIARTSGTRNFPWRIIAVADDDIQLLNNEIVYKLAQPNRIADPEWIKPGQVAWDWWNHWNLTGVDFRAGINNQTYEYYIDFAAENKIPYFIMDDGWYVLGDLTKESPDIDVAHLTKYAAERGVGVILWCSWLTLEGQMDEALDLFQKWGVKGIKVDFMNRDDQDIVNFYWRCAGAAAKRKLLVDFHGSYKPSGIHRPYPNVINSEGVLGMENSKWSDHATPDMAVTIPYIRMFAGPMDYTPGAMRNAGKADFRAIFDYPMSQGTRCQQMAMYVVYDAPLQMLSDNPTIYEKNKECVDFITSVPVTWDMTIPLAGEVGKYVLLARQKDNTFFAGAMTNWDARDIEVDFSFLPEGNWQIEIFQDGINADQNGIDYKKITSTVNNSKRLKIHLAPGGGWVAKIYR